MVLPFLIHTIQEQLGKGISRNGVVENLIGQGYKMQDILDTWTVMDNPNLGDQTTLDSVVIKDPIQPRSGPPPKLVERTPVSVDQPATQTVPTTAPLVPPRPLVPPAPPPTHTVLPPLSPKKSKQTNPNILLLFLSFIIIPLIGGLFGYAFAQQPWNPQPERPTPAPIAIGKEAITTPSVTPSPTPTSTPTPTTVPSLSTTQATQRNSKIVITPVPENTEAGGVTPSPILTPFKE